MFSNKQKKYNLKLLNSAISALFLIFFIGESAIAGSDRLNINLSFQTTYDDNILNYSDADLDLMDDTTASEDRYGIKSKDDYILIPELEIIYKARLAGHSTHFGLQGTYYYYQENDLKRYYKIRGFIKRYLKKGVYLQTSFSLIPDYYYRNSYSTSSGYQEAKFDKLSGELKFAVGLFEGLRSNLYYTYAKKDFIPLFDERDITSHDFKIEAIYRPAKSWKGWGFYTFSTAKGAGADNPDYKRDTSHDSFEFTAGSRFYLKGFKGQGFELAGWATYKQIYFQTDKLTSEDSYRLGRKDNRWTISMSANHDITSRLNIGVNFKRVIKRTDLPAEDLKEFLEYSSNSFYIILDYRF